MDLVRIDDVIRARREDEIPVWTKGDAFVSGGTWLFSEPQPAIARLIDLAEMPWAPVTITADRVEIAANCTYRKIEDTAWSDLEAATLFPAAIRSLSSSFKTYGVATVGGNLCLAYAKGMMGPVFVALGATYELCSAAAPPRQVPAHEFQTGVRQTILCPGEYLRKIIIPRQGFARRAVLKRTSFTSTSHATAMAIATFDRANGETALTLSGALAYPVRIALSPEESPEDAIDAVCAKHPLIADSHGSKEYRQALLHWLAREALNEVVT